jgi:hypothetical protein
VPGSFIFCTSTSSSPSSKNSSSIFAWLTKHYSREAVEKKKYIQTKDRKAAVVWSAPFPSLIHKKERWSIHHYKFIHINYPASDSS